MKRLVLALVTLLCVRAAADIIHVPGQYPTIQAGIDAADAGDIVLVAAGTYVEEINLKAGVVVRGAGMGQSTIDGNNDPGDVVRAVGNAIGPDTKLEGFTIRGAANGGGMPGGGGVFCNSGARPEIVRCRVTANDAGVALWNGSAALVRNCVIDHNTYDGVSTGAGATIVNNTIHANRIGLYDYSGYGPVMMNNIVTGNSLYGVYGPSGGTPPSLTYNCVWGNATDYHQATPGIGSISHDPLYADTAAADYHLQPVSPCIDSGNPAPQYNDPDGSRCDIGAYGGPAAPSERPLVVTLIPEANDPACEPGIDIAAGFNVAMDPATLNGATFRAHGAFTGWHWGTVSYDTTSRVVTLEGIDQFWPGEPAFATLTKSVLSSGGDSLGGYSWGFTAAVEGGSGVFADTIHASGTASNRCLCAADLDGDGDIDAAGGWSGANIYLNDGTGRLTLHRQLAAGRVSAIIAGDWNSDSIVDLAAAYELFDEAVAVWVGLGGGEFSPAVEYFCIAPPCDIDAADVNLDGHLDLVAANGGSDSVGVFWGYGDGTFTTIRTFPSGGESEAAAVGDLNNDGWPDIVTGNRVEDDLSVLLGNGDGTFERTGRYVAAPHPTDVTLADINDDGNLDAIVTADMTQRVLTMLGDGTGALSGRREYPLVSRPGRLALADFDGDGKLDIAAPGLDSGTVSLLRGRGDGTFDGAVRCLNLGSVTGLAAADLDGDGDIDLAVGGNGLVVTALNYYALRVVSAAPLPYSPAVPPDTTLSAEFTVALDPATLDSASFKAFGSMTGAHFGATNWDSTALTARLDPFADFAAGEEVTAVLTSRIRSVRGGGLGGYGWTFATWDFGNARGVFGAPNDFPAGSEVRGTWAADFDRDGDIDVAVTANIPAAVAILMNDGLGRFAAPVFTGTAGDPISLFGADFDSDGDVDLAVFHNQPGSSHLEILRNDGAGNFTVAHDYTPAVLGQDVSGADFDSDGDIDLVLSDGWGSQNNVRVMTNNGAGAFTGPVNYSAGSAARGCAVLDAEGDGDFDIVVANQSNNTVSLLYNDGSGTFTAQADFAAGPGPDRIAVADFTLDGFADIAVGSAAYTTVAVLENDGSGGFDVESYDCGGTSRSIAAADLDRNRTPDILLAQGSAGLTVMLNDGSGGFQAYTPYPAGSAPWDCFIADFDSDRALDIGCSNYSSGTVSLLFDAGLGLADGPSSLAPRPSPLASVVRGVLMGRQLTADGSRQALLDAAGRRVMELAAGANDVRHLAPGVYFVRALPSTAGCKPSRVTKVVIAR